jgi:hypothetical protein
MDKKIDQLKACAASGDWTGALRIAAKFPRLGADKARIERGWEAVARPDFMRQIGKDPDALMADGIAALKSRYSL